MGATVKPELEAVPSPLENAGAANDRFVETLGDVVTRKLADILQDAEADAVARVSAGKALLEWIRPKKGVQINVPISGPTYVSHLNLPAPQPPSAQAFVEATLATPHTRVLPESPPALAAAKLTAYAEVEPGRAPDIELSQLHREQSPSRPALEAPNASTVKMYRQ